MKILVCLFAFLISSAAEALIIPEHYLSGSEICDRYQGSREGEMGFRVPVPVSYQEENSVKTSLYAWTKKPYDKEKPTVIFVSGGPGDTAHNATMHLDRWNVVYFDQRGNSCSKPESREIYLSHQFYSSENTARDINTIREFLRIPKVSIYAVGYGTVPAQIYGSLFPLNIQALVLEAVIYKSDESLNEPQVRRQRLQNFFHSLPLEQQNRILELSRRPDLPKNWFSTAGLMMLSQDSSQVMFQQFLDSTIWNEENLSTTLGVFKKTDSEDTEFGFGDVMMGMIGCQELNMNNPGISLYSHFQGRELIADAQNSLQNLYCQPLGFESQLENKTFVADQYPVHAPVTYFQGAGESETYDHLALHSTLAALGRSQQVTLAGPSSLPLNDRVEGVNTPAISWIHRSVLQQALEGLALSADDIEGLNQAAQTSWVLKAP